MKPLLISRWRTCVRGTIVVAGLLAMVCVIHKPSFAQRELSGSAQARLALERLNVTGSVLMIAAHPDDENSALLAYLARGRRLRTGYLSLTRGEGGQNLIGPEQGDALGVIRTQELLAARRIDGAEQFFTRAIDFGFTKTPQETFEKWGREKILGDVVWVIRRFQPDVIILRFSGTPRDGHGQHQASAILGREAFKAAADPTKFPEQLKWVKPWQATRLMWNPAAFTKQQREEDEKTPHHIVVDPGQYDPVLGYSYSEIAGMSRSMHRSQGMGAALFKGSNKDYLVTQGGPVATHDIFDGIDITWNRVPGGAAVGAPLAQALKDFDPEHPELIVPLLLKAQKAMDALKDIPQEKRKNLSDAIALCSGLWLDATADKYAVTPGGLLKFNATALNRDHVPVQIESVKIDGIATAVTKDKFGDLLPFNESKVYKLTATVSTDQPLSQPYWLVEPRQGDVYSVPNQLDVGLAQNPPLFDAHFHLRIESQDVEVDRPVEYRYIARDRGELTRPVIVEPPVSLEWSQGVVVFPKEAAKTAELQVKADMPKAAGEIHIEAPPGWKVSSNAENFHLADSGEESALSFQVTPPAGDQQGLLHATAQVDGQTVSTEMEVINYPHIPPQVLFPPASAKLVRVNVKLIPKNIGYIMGAGDEMPQALRQMGANVTLLNAEELATGDLSRFDAIVTGVRAYNVRADLRANQERLLDYVKNGGTMVVQYNVAEGGNPFGGANTHYLDSIGPYPLTTGRERVTVEEAPVQLPHPNSPLLHEPNDIRQSDFAGWIQERGLYFASKWDNHYTPLFEMHDPGQKPQLGSTLYTRYGKGAYVFTAISWFRELPAGVPGAFRIFANLLSAGKSL